MRKRIAKEILKNQGLLNYSEQQIKKAQQKLAKLHREKKRFRSAGLMA